MHIQIHMMIIYGENTNVLQGQVHLFVAATNETLYNNKMKNTQVKYPFNKYCAFFIPIKEESTEKNRCFK